MKRQGKDGHLQAQEGGLEQILSSQPSEGTGPADILISNFQPPEPGDNKYVSWKPSGLWCFVMVPEHTDTLPSTLVSVTDPRRASRPAGSLGPMWIGRKLISSKATFPLRN